MQSTHLQSSFLLRIPIFLLIVFTLQPAWSADLLLDFGPTTVTNVSPGFDATVSPAYEGTGTTWNKVELADISSGLLFNDGTAATGVSIDLGQEAVAGDGIIAFSTQPTGATLSGSSGGTGIYSGTRVGRDGIFGSGTPTAGCAIGLRIDGLAAGKYVLYFMARNTNTATGQPMRIYAAGGASAATFSFVASGNSAEVPNDSALSTTVFLEGYNYHSLEVTLTAGQSLFVAVDGSAAEKRSFLNALEITPYIAPTETIGGGTIGSPAVGPAPAFGVGGPGFTLVKNWNFGANGTIKTYGDMNANFKYQTQWDTVESNYGAKMVAHSNSSAIVGQPVELVGTTGRVREFFSDSVKTYVVPLKIGGVEVTTVKADQKNAGSGSFVAKYALESGGSVLGQDIIWETRVRYTPFKQFWFSVWNAGRQATSQGPEMDLIETYSWYNASEPGGWSNLSGNIWQSQNGTVEYANWANGMTSVGINSSYYDPTQYHTITWLLRSDDTTRVFVDGIEVQRQDVFPWRRAGDPAQHPVNVNFLFDGTFGHVSAANGNVNKAMAASELLGKYFEWDYSRIYLRGTANPVPIDNVSAVQTPSNSWSLSTTSASGLPDRFYGANHLHDGNDKSVVKTVRFTPNLPKAGSYEVYATWVTHTNRSTSVPFIITHADGTTTVNKSQNGGDSRIEWRPLGTYTFNAGTSGNVTISNQGTTGYVGADAVYFVPVPAEKIQDNYSSATGTWTNVTTVTGSKMRVTPGQYYGTGYYHDNHAGKGTKTATSVATLPSAGTYSVYAMWSHDPARPRATNVPYAITHSGGTANVVKDQTVGGGQWNLLGTYTFGTTGTVVISNAGTDGFVVFDAIRYVKQ